MGDLLAPEFFLQKFCNPGSLSKDGMVRAFEWEGRGISGRRRKGGKFFLPARPFFRPAQALEIDRTRAFEEGLRF